MPGLSAGSSCGILQPSDRQSLIPLGGKDVYSGSKGAAELNWRDALSRFVQALQGRPEHG